jgi:uncharacterized membrane protein
LEKTSQKRKSGWLRHLGNTFLVGTLTAIPLVATYFVLRFLFVGLDGIFQPVIKHFLGRSLPGVGLVALVILVYLLGLVAANVIGRTLIRWFDALMCRTPIIKYIYSAAKQVVDSLRRLGGVEFKKVAIVEFPKTGMYSLAFVTSKAVDFKGQKKVPLFIPHTPNPMTGFLVLLSPEEVIDTDLTIEDAMKMVLSGGLLSPEAIG